jgi:hypothetical protein
VAFAKQLVGPVFNTYTDQFLKSMSGFNFFLKQNIDEFDGSPDYSLVKATEGKLFNGGVTAGAASATTNDIAFTWSVNLGSNGLDADAVYCGAYNEGSGRWGFMAAEDARDQGGTGSSISLNIGVGATIHLYLFFIQRVGNQITMISDSAHDSAVGA